MAVTVPQAIAYRRHPHNGDAIVMEKIKGASLSQILEFPERYQHLWPVVDFLDREQLVLELRSCIETLHHAGMTHSDLYKRNLMIGENGRLYVIDFGRAKHVNAVEDEEDRRKSDLNNVKNTLGDFFSQFDALTKTN
jgi:tRNA A-37 threonylcarbamoyl transferase component Bud32